ncbi:MAG: hypothetical protein ABI572_13045 [Actinomycetota bacterium]
METLIGTVKLTIVLVVLASLAQAAESVKVTPWRGSARLGAHAHRRIKLVVRMMRRSTDVYQGERFRLRFGGAAVRP